MYTYCKISQLICGVLKRQMPLIKYLNKNVKINKWISEYAAKIPHCIHAYLLAFHTEYAD